MGPKRRERFNAKARQSSVGGSSHKGKKSMRQRIAQDEVDANAEIMDDATRQALIEQDRARRELLREGGNDDTAKLSTKKKRRLDKFIEAKLRKEEKARIMEKLAKSSADIGDRTELVSASTLGTGRVSREAERVQHLIDAESGKRKRAAAFVVEEDEDDEDLDAAEARTDEGDADLERGQAQPGDIDTDERQERIRAALKKFEQAEPKPAPKAAPGFGSALAAPAFGSALAPGAGAGATPVMRKRQRKDRTSERSNMSVRDRIVRAPRIEVTGNETDSSFDTDDESSSVHVYDVDKMMERRKQEEDDSVATDELESEEPDTDADEEEVLLEAMRRRGLIPKDATEIPEEWSAHKSKGALRGTSFASEGVSNEEQEGDEEEEEEEEDGEDKEEEKDEKNKEDEDDVDHVTGDDTEARSKRRGIVETERSRGFKQWAMEALRLARPEASDERPLEPVGGMVQRVGDLVPKDGRAYGPLGGAVPIATTPFAERYLAEEALLQQQPTSPIRHVHVARSDEMQESRMQLPVVAEEDHITRTINENPVTVLCGETGSGKTTQVPQFLYEAAYGTSGSANPGMIGVTQPRRVAAVSMARRVATELCLSEHRVSHQIRYDATTSPQTQVKFMTDGVLLRELAEDLLLKKYSVVIVDEAHERSVNTDVLIGMLSRVVRLREKQWLAAPAGLSAPRPLRLVIMSATLRIGDFTDNTVLFPTPPPVIHIGARQHPVAIHFNRRTVQDYVTEAVKKTSKIHTRLPPGGILVFLTGQQEVQTVCRKLEQRYGAAAVSRRTAAAVARAAPAVSARVADVEAEEVDLGTADALPVEEPVDAPRDEEALDTDDEGSDEDDLVLPDAEEPMHVLPLYSLLPTHEQQRVFEPPPEGHRLVVVATNVAETSITIPNVRYVVDSGRAKERRIDGQSQVQSYSVAWISKASAAQRAGRAGRTGPGHCYRLYSSAVYEDIFAEFGLPEILRTPVDGLVLQMKAMHIDHVANFPFPTPPDRGALRDAERTLVHLGALERAPARVEGGRRREMHASITALGRAMALFPVVPRYAKLLVQGNQHGCLPYAVALVAALSVGDVFEREDILPLPPHDEEDAAAHREARRAARGAYYKALRVFDALGGGASDAFRLLSVVGAYSHDAARGASLSFCREHFVRPKAMEEIHKLRAQLSQILAANLAGLSDVDAARLQDPSLTPPDAAQCKALRQLLAAIYIDRVAVRADVVGAPEADAAPVRGAKMASTRGVPYVALGVPGPVYIHVSSALFHRAPPEWVVFGAVHQSAPKEAVVDGGTDAPPPRRWLKMLTRISPAWIPTLGRSLCAFSQPSESAAPDVRGQLRGAMRALKEGGSAGIRRQVLLTPRYGGALEDGAAAGGLGWELPPVRATQVLEQGRWVTLAS